MHPMLNIAIRAVRAAGNVIIRHIDRVYDLEINQKSKNDFVTEVDRKAESVIIDTILKAYPSHAIIAEESGTQGDNEYTWIIDPLDGTTNYLHGFPQYAVSIAVTHKGILTQGVIYDPLRQELFTASKGEGAYLDNKRIRVSKQKGLDGSLLGTGFPFRASANIDQYIETLRSIFPITAGVRRAGAATLDLAYVACGRLDGFWEFGLKPWDIAAGALLIIESGGIITNIDGSELDIYNGNIIAGNLHCHEEIIKIINQ